jgi:hypothetical protein
MTVLDGEGRKRLETAVLRARDIVEQAAAAALDYLGVNRPQPGEHLSDKERQLRRDLRVEQRRLGSYQALVRACAYEQWHRMLFARFLDANGLLLHPQLRVRLSLQECEELAAQEPGTDRWDLAARFASETLPGIFRPDDPLIRVPLAPEHRQALEEVLESLPEEVFLSSDGLGWSYQYWQSRRKQEVNSSGEKICGDDICAVTQLFTEHYMVSFLLQNTLGAWWLSRRPDSPLRRKWTYYRPEIQHDFSGWPETAAGITLMDPCCGSGHFLVEAFHMLRDIRAEEIGDGPDVIAAILRHNLFGLELDQRCVQIAAFALALEAWKAGFPPEQAMPVPNVACTGLSPSADREQWKRLARVDDLLARRLEELHEIFRNAGELGSLIDPVQMAQRELGLEAERVQEGIRKALERERMAGDPAAVVLGEAANGLLRAFDLLRRTYHIVVTNPPFLLVSKAGPVLSTFCKARHPEAGKDLATCFVERCRAFTAPGGLYALVNPQNWLFQKKDLKLRRKMLQQQRWLAVARLGEHGFASPQAAGAFTALLIFSDRPPTAQHCFLGIDASEPRRPEEKAAILREARVPEEEGEEQQDAP